MTQLYDASSKANYNHWSTAHTTLDVELNFKTKSLQGKSFAEKYIIGDEVGCWLVGFIFQPKYRLKFVQEADM